MQKRFRQPDFRGLLENLTTFLPLILSWVGILRKVHSVDDRQCQIFGIKVTIDYWHQHFRFRVFSLKQR